jgi:SAM-dependent methyltransferase
MPAPMPDDPRPNQEQAALWNAAAGHTWAELHRVLDRMLAPFEPMLVDGVVHDGRGRVLDVGCGAGATTLSAARRLRPGGSCLGVDLSAPLIEVAERRAREEGLDNAAFLVADAQTHAFEPDAFDAVISRFGVMFFDDPVAAFRNIARAARRDAHLTFVAWRGPAENPFMTTAAAAAAPWLPSLPPPDPDAPGQFAFADPERVRRILHASGWRDVEIRAVDVRTSVAEGDLMVYAARMGPVGRALGELDPERRASAVAAVQAAFGRLVEDGTAQVDTACWLVRAHGGG